MTPNAKTSQSKGGNLNKSEKSARKKEEQRQANIVKNFMYTHDATLYGGYDGEIDENDTGRLLQTFLNHVYVLEEALAKQEKFKLFLSKEATAKITER
jgi:hypothetical protein